jgi:membrane-associated protease RseP (regulator of RpoE activity)
VSDAPATADNPQQGQPSQVTFTVYQGPPLDTIRNLVASHFLVKDAFIDQYGIPTVQVAAEPPHEKFRTLLKELGQNNLIGSIRGAGDTLTIRVFGKPQRKGSRKTLNLALFFATVGSVLAAGYFNWSNSDLFVQLVEPSGVLTKASLFAVGLLAIIGLHEFGHKAATNHHGLDATFPYFIPGPPPVGTFGALISLRGPPENRDQLFDLGLSGPVVGFIVTIIIATFSLLLSTTVAPAVAQQLISGGATQDLGFCLPLVGTSPNVACEAPLLLIVGRILMPATTPGSLMFPNQELWFAAHIGALLTFLNIVPAWQLDGGHISRAVFGPRGHRTATLVGLVILFVSGYLVFAFFLLIMMNLNRRGFAGVEPLDDVSTVSNSRKILYVLAIAMLLLTFFPSPFL